MIDLRKIAIIFVVGILFSIFVWALAEAIHPSPRYEDFCTGNERFAVPLSKVDREGVDCPDFTGPTIAEQDTCEEQHGNINYRYDESSCAVSWNCQTCNYQYQEAQKQFNLSFFIISSILGLIAIGIGLYLPGDKISHWVASGFMLGGIISLFIGTARYFGDLGRYTRPVIILLELIIVIYIFYKKMKK